MEAPAQFSVWRAPTDNDRNIRVEWEKAGYRYTTPRVYSCTGALEGDNAVITASLSLGALVVQRILTIQAQYTVSPDGKVACRFEAVRSLDDRLPKMPFLPRFGLCLTLPEKMDQVSISDLGPTRATWITPSLLPGQIQHYCRTNA